MNRQQKHNLKFKNRNRLGLYDNILEVKFTKKEMNVLINNKRINESKLLASVLNKIKLIAKKTKIGFNTLKNFFKKIYSSIREIPKVKIIAGILLISVSANLINSSLALAKNIRPHSALSAAVEKVQNSDSNSNEEIIIQDGKVYYVVDAGNEGLNELMDCIESGSDVTAVPQAMPGVEVSVNVTFSETKGLSDRLEGIWGKYTNLIQQNEELNFVHITSEINGEKINFLFVPNPEKITYEELLEILKNKNIKLPDPNLYQSIERSVGERTGEISGAVSHPVKYPDDKWSFVAGRSESAKGTLLHEASHLFGIQKSLAKIAKIIDRAENKIKVGLQGAPIYVDNLTSIKNMKTDSDGQYVLKDLKHGLSKDHMINLIGHSHVLSNYSPKTKDSTILKKQAEWVFSIGLGLGRIKSVTGKKDVYTIVQSATGQKLEYYVDGEETSRYEDSIRHFIEETKGNKVLSKIGKKITIYYKSIGLEEIVKKRVKKILDNRAQDPHGYKLAKDISNFRSELIDQFNKMIEKEVKNNNDIDQKDTEMLYSHRLNVIYFLTKYYVQELQSINAEGGNVHNELTITDNKINSLNKLDRFSQQLHESVSKLVSLQEKVYIKLLRL